MTWLDLGVGLALMPGLTDALANVEDLIDCLEVEPQTFWWETGDPARPFRLEADLLADCRRRFDRLLVHGVTSPVGGTSLPAREVVELYQQTADLLGAELASEHLAFNRVDTAESSYTTAFFLPPRQTPAGVAAAVTSIDVLRAGLRAPFSVETPVNYLHPRDDEMDDGAFMAAVADRADCGILLDLHNIWVNERNGRQNALDYVSQLPLERVWEVHLAGGFQRRGFWLDAHSGDLHPDLLTLARTVLPMLPQLRAVVYEVMPEFVNHDATNLRGDLQQVRDLVTGLRRTGHRVVHNNATPDQQVTPGPLSPTRGGELTPHDWERTLGALVTGQQGGRDEPVDRRLSADPGVVLLRELVAAGRAGRIASSLPLTVSLLTNRLDVQGVEELFERYSRQCPPALWGSTEGRAFARWLQRTNNGDRFLHAALTLDQAGLDAIQNEASVTVELDVDPNVLVSAIYSGLEPEICNLPVGRYAAVIGL